MTEKHDYARYGDLKTSQAILSPRAVRIAKLLGIGPRYLRYVRDLDKSLPAVELGCGDGSFVRALREAGFSGVRGVDLSPSYNMPEGCEVGDAISFLKKEAPASLGLVVALDVLEHLEPEDLKSLFRLVGKRLHPDGRFLARVPNMGSPFGLINQFGDLSHRTALNEISVQQLAFDTGLRILRIEPEPMAYPRTLSSILGRIIWPFYRTTTKLVFAAFGIQARILTPNLVFVLARDRAQ